MRKIQVILVLLGAVAILMTACGTANSAAKAERQAQVARQVQSALESRHYTIAVDWMKPLGGMPRHVSSDYELKINGDEVDSYLPYVGEAYRLPYGGGKGLNFKGRIDHYQLSQTTSNRYVIEFDVTNDEDTYHYRIDMFNNGKAVIDVIARDRDAISFDGELVL